MSEEAGDLAAAEKYYSQALVEYPEAFRLEVLYGEVELGLLGKRRPRNARRAGAPRPVDRRLHEERRAATQLW